MSRYNLSSIMKRAWELFREFKQHLKEICMPMLNDAFSVALKEAWEEAKYQVWINEKENNKVKVTDLRIGDIVEMSIHYTFQKATPKYYRVLKVYENKREDTRLYPYMVNFAEQDNKEHTMFFKEDDAFVITVKAA